MDKITDKMRLDWLLNLGPIEYMIFEPSKNRPDISWGRDICLKNRRAIDKEMLRSKAPREGSSDGK